MDAPFTAPANDLTAAVKYAARWLSNRPTVPIQGGLLFEIDGDDLSIFGFNENATGGATIKVQSGANEGGFVVAGRLADALLSTFPKGDIVVEHSGPLVTMTGTRAEVTMPVMSDSDYPTLPTIAPPIGTVNGPALAEAIRRVAVAAGRDEKQHMLMGMHLRFTGSEGSRGELAVLATDRHRLAREVIEWEVAPDAELGEPVVPLASVLVGATEALARSTEVVIGREVSAAGGSFSLLTEDRSLVMRLLPTDRYPQVEGMFTALKPDSHVTVMVSDLAPAVKRAEMVRDTITHGIGFMLRQGLVVVGGTAAERASGSGEVDADYDGPDTSFTLRSDLIADALASAPHNRVTISFKAGEYLPVRLSCDGSTWQQLIMPIK